MTQPRTLNLPENLPIGVGEAEKAAIKSTWSTADTEHAKFGAAGFLPHAQPKSACPELTVDLLTTKSYSDYTQAYVELLSWFSYASEILARIESHVLELKNMRDILAAQTRRNSRATAAPGEKRPTAQEQDDRLLLSVEYQEVLRELQRYEQARLLYKARVDGIETSLRVISRQVEIRRQEIEGTGSRQNNPPQGGYGRRPWSG